MNMTTLLATTIRQVHVDRRTKAILLFLATTVAAAAGVWRADSQPQPNHAMSQSHLSPEDKYQSLEPEGRAFLNCRIRRPAGFEMPELPAETLDYEDPKAFLPLGVFVSSIGPQVVSVATRPAYGDGLVSQWLGFLCRESGYDHGEIKAIEIGGLRAVACDAMQQGDGVVMRMRLVLLEEGGRMYQLSAMAPQEIWSAVEGKLDAALQSFEVEAPGGQSVALFEQAVEEEAKPAETARLSRDEWNELVLANDTESLNPEHPMNANLRNSGNGFTPRTFEVDAEERSVVIGIGAIEGFVKIPFGWHALDDGRRGLIFDAAGRMQINLSVRDPEGMEMGDFVASCFEELLREQPDLEITSFEMEGIACSAVRDADFDGERLCQAFLARPREQSGYAIVARVTANSDDIRLAMNLAGDVMANLRFHPVASR